MTFVHRRTRGVVVTLLGAAVALIAPAAHASGRNVVLLKVKAHSARANTCKRSVISVLRSRNKLMSTSKYMRTRKVLKRYAWNKRAISAVARAIGADAVVHVHFAWRRGKLNMIVRVREGKSGRIVDTLSFPLRRGRCGMRTLRTLRDRLLATIDRVERIDDFKEEPHETEQATDTDDDENPTADTSKSKAKTDSDSDSDSDVSKDSSDFEAPDSSLHAVGGHINVGFSAIGRQLEFGVASGIPDNMRPRPYQSSMVGGVHVDAELYPFLRKSKGSFFGRQLSRIGVAFDLDHSVAMKSTLSLSGTPTEFATTQSRWSLGARYRIPIGRSAIKLAAGYDELGLVVADGTIMTGVPDVTYGAVDLGGDVDIALGSHFTLGLGGRFLAVTGAGEISTGAAYGRAVITGVSGRAQIDAHVTKSLTLSAGLSLLQISLDFAGTGDMSDVNGDNQQDVNSASDTYSGGFVSAGYRF